MLRIATNGKVTPSRIAVCAVRILGATPTPIWQLAVAAPGAVIVKGLPSEWTPVSTSGWPGWSFSSREMKPGAVTGLPFTVRTLSPTWRPARAAGLPARTLWILPGSSFNWVISKPLISSIAIRKLATGPAARMAMRCSGCLEWKPFGSLKSPASIPPIRT